MASTLSTIQADLVRALVARAAANDGINPLNEEALLALDRESAETSHLLADDGLSYAQLDARHGSAQLVVDPSARRQGRGTALLDQLRHRTPDPHVWAFGNLPAAQRLAAAQDMAPVRGLHIMAISLAGHTTVPGARGPVLPEGVAIRPFTDADTAAFLALNAAAFAGHPEQGSFSSIDLAARKAEAWFDPAGFLLAERDGQLLGFHWTKRHDALTGEVYVLATAPAAQGLGLGKILLNAGLTHLANAGCREAILYVDIGNTRAVDLYERAGFTVRRSDVQYARNAHER